MIDFLLKSTLSLGLLYAVYILLLEREKMHKFNRFFLLFSLLFSLIIPFITFEIHIESSAVLPENTIQAMQFSSVIVEQKVNYLPLFLWSIYGIVTAILISRFIIHLIKIQQKISSNTIEKIENYSLILLNEKVLPHTFLNNIFINKEDYENRKIEAELFSHELTHVRQKHTIDILLIEILKTIFWFNPLFIFYKKAIQLNHEFLADETVVQSYNNVPFYQNLLLEKASWNNTFYLASNLNFLVTKKRLIMMTKSTTKMRERLSQLSVLPILAGLIFISCSEVSPNKNTDKSEVVENVEVVGLSPDEIPTSPMFPGGIDLFYDFVGKNYKMPEVKDLNGRVYISFAVNSDGSLDEFKILRDIGHGTGEEAIRILKLSPKWIPGELNGKPVRVQYSLPISIKS